MPSAATIIAKAWDFYRSQPLLNTIIFVLLFLPLAILDLFSWALPSDVEVGTLVQLNASLGVAILIASVLLPIILIVCLIWADAAIILIGKKLIEQTTGRNRSSFRETAREARKFILPLLLTGILMSCGVILWSLLLIIPGIIFATRVLFYEVVIVAEGQAYRGALRRSMEVVKGRTGKTFLTTLVLSLYLFLPIGILQTLLELVNERRLLLAGTLALDGIHSILYTLFLLSLVILYGELKDMPRMVTPEPTPRSS